MESVLRMTFSVNQPVATEKTNVRREREIDGDDGKHCVREYSFN